MSSNIYKSAINYSKTAYSKKTPYPTTYDPITGVVEQWARDKKGSFRWGHGFLQNSWPVFALKACPNIPIPEDYPINYKQTSEFYHEILEQDLDAPLKNLLPVQEPSEDQVSVGDISEGFHGMEGKIIEIDEMDNRKFVVNPAFNQIIETSNGEDVMDVAHVMLYPDSNIVKLTWQHKEPETFETPQEMYRTYMLHMTEYKHKIFSYIDWLLKQEQVQIPDLGADTPLKFTNTTLEIPNSNDVNWWLDGQNMVFDFPDLPPQSFPWTQIAKNTKWPSL